LDGGELFVREIDHGGAPRRMERRTVTASNFYAIRSAADWTITTFGRLGFEILSARIKRMTLRPRKSELKSCWSACTDASTRDAACCEAPRPSGSVHARRFQLSGCDRSASLASRSAARSPKLADRCPVITIAFRSGSRAAERERKRVGEAVATVIRELERFPLRLPKRAEGSSLGA
jgi:hypothetical protein